VFNVCFCFAFCTEYFCVSKKTCVVNYYCRSATFECLLCGVSVVFSHMYRAVCYVGRKIMVMPRTSMNTPDKHGQKNLGFFLQCNGDTDSQLVFAHLVVVNVN